MVQRVVVISECELVAAVSKREEQPGQFGPWSVVAPSKREQAATRVINELSCWWCTTLIRPPPGGGRKQHA